PSEIGPLSLGVEPYSPREIDFPVIRRAHEASALASTDAVQRWRKAVAPSPRTVPPKLGLGPSLEEVVRRRGSTRQFGRVPITLAELEACLRAAVAPVPGEVPPLCDLYVTAHAVEGLEPGAYAYDRAAHELRLLRAGEFRRAAGFLAPGQDLAADASANG